MSGIVRYGYDAGQIMSVAVAVWPGRSSIITVRIVDREDRYFIVSIF